MAELIPTLKIKVLKKLTDSTSKVVLLMFIRHFTLYKFMIIFLIMNFKCISSNSRSSYFQTLLGLHAPLTIRENLAHDAQDSDPPRSFPALTQSV